MSSGGASYRPEYDRDNAEKAWVDPRMLYDQERRERELAAKQKRLEIGESEHEPPEPSDIPA
jgi:hypothetical protein